MNLYQCNSAPWFDGPASGTELKRWKKTGHWQRFIRSGEPVDKVKAISDLGKALGIKFRIKEA